MKLPTPALLLAAALFLSHKPAQGADGDDVSPVRVVDIFDASTISIPEAYEQQSFTGPSGIEYLVTVKADGTGGAQFKLGSSSIAVASNNGYLLEEVSVDWGTKSNEDMTLYSSAMPFTASDAEPAATAVATIGFEANATTPTTPGDEPCRYIALTSTAVKGKACAWQAIRLTWVAAELEPEPEEPEQPEESEEPEQLYTLVINEIMQSNIDCYYFDNEFPDSWVELYNASADEILLDGHRLGLSDSFDTAYELSGGITVAPGGYIVVACDKEETGGLHTTFRLESTSKGMVCLFAPDGTLLSNVAHPKMPAPNIAYGRLSDGADEWGHEVTPTPGEPNNGIVSATLLPAPLFSLEGGVFDSPVELTITLPEDELPDDVRLAVTTDGREPSPADAVDDNTLALSLEASTVVRARLISAQALNPLSVTQSYIFHPRTTPLTIVSIVTDPAHLYDPETGIFAGEGDDANWLNNWRRPINIEFFEGNDHAATINQLCETRVMGNASRSHPQKSINVYANKRFGTKRFASSNFWPDKPGVEKTKSFTLRNGGNDFTGLHMRDQLAQALIGRNCPDVDWMAYSPVIYYINGQYKGLYDLRERSNEDFVEANYEGLEDIDMVENWWEVKTEDLDLLNDLVFPLGYAASLEEFEQVADIDNFLGMYILEFFANNKDFLSNNIVCWRSRLDEHPRWRWIIKDVDFFGTNSTDNYFQFVEDAYNQNEGHRKLWHNIFNFFITDPEGSNLFIDRLAIALGDFFQPSYTKATYAEMAARIDDEYPWHATAWHDNPDELVNSRINQEPKLMAWLDQRPDVLYSQMQEHFSLGPTYRLTIDTEGMDITANGLPLTQPQFNGRYFAGRDLELSVATTDGSQQLSWCIEEYSDEDDGSLTDISITKGNSVMLSPGEGCRIVAYPMVSSALDGAAVTPAAAMVVRPVAGGLCIGGCEGPVEVYALDGRLITRLATSTVALAPGVYIIKATLADGTPATAKATVR